MAAVTCEDDVSKLKKGKHVTDENIIKTIQAVGHCFCELRENKLGTKGHPIVGPRHTLFHWMDLMDLVANELNLKFLDVPEPAVIYHILCQVDVAPLKDEKHTYASQGWQGSKSYWRGPASARRPRLCPHRRAIRLLRRRQGPYYTVSVNVSSNLC